MDLNLLSFFRLAFQKSLADFGKAPEDSFVSCPVGVMLQSRLR